MPSSEGQREFDAGCCGRSVRTLWALFIARHSTLLTQVASLCLIGVVVFRMTQLVLVVDFKLLWGFGLLIYFAYGRLIFPLVLVITIIVIVLGTRSWRWRDAFGFNIAHKVSWMCRMW